MGTWYFIYPLSQNNLPVKLNVSFYISREAFYFYFYFYKEEKLKLAYMIKLV